MYSVSIFIYNETFNPSISQIKSLKFLGENADDEQLDKPDKF
jgi:hypothetical protein